VFANSFNPARTCLCGECPVLFQQTISIQPKPDPIVQGQISELTGCWTAVASEMRPYQSDLGENALLKDENRPVYEPASADPHEQVVDEGDSVAGQ
jgi:hypothetical protein